MSRKKSDFAKAPSGVCGNCGQAVTNRGRAPRSGFRYCMQPDCRAAKARNERRPTPPRPPAQSACSGCGRPLPPRARWANDGLGRWCKRAKCRAERIRVQSEGGVDKLPEALRRIHLLETALKFAGDVVMCESDRCISDSRVTCKKCGLTSAVPRWLHQARDGSACFGTLEDQQPRGFGDDGLVVAWPFKREYVEVVP